MLARLVRTLASLLSRSAKVIVVMDPSLKNALREVARDEDDARADDATWVARAAGSLSEKEEAELTAKAASSDRAAFMHALTAPKGTAFEDRIASAIGLAPAAPAVTNVVPFVRPAAPASRRTPRALYIGAPLLAVAAALALVARSPSSGGDGALPGYALTVEGGDMASRGDTPAPVAGERITFTAGAHVVVLARPSSPVTSPVRAQASLVRGGEARPVGVQGVVSSAGAARFEGSFADVFGNARGDWDLVIWIKPTAQNEKAAGEYRQPVRLVEGR